MYDQAIAAQNAVHPTLRATAAGAPAAVIGALEARLGAPLPPEHRLFLADFGGGGGPDVLGLDARAATLLDAIGATSGRLPDGWALVAVATDEPYLDLYLHQQAGQPDRLVLGPSCIGYSFDRFAEAGNTTQVADGIADLLYSQAMLTTIYRQPHRALFHDSDQGRIAPDDVLAVLAACGLSAVWRTSAHTAASGEGGFALCEHHGEGWRLHLGGDDRDLVLRAARNLARAGRRWVEVDLDDRPNADPMEFRIWGFMPTLDAGSV